MLKRICICSFVAVVAAWASAAGPTPSAGVDAYPVLCWTYYAFTNRLDDARTVADWKELGINRPLSPRVDGNTDKAASATFLAARIQREEAPRLEPLLNLLPWFDWIGPRIGAKSLGEYLDRCRRESGLDFLGYDCYAQQKHGRADRDLDDYFANLREWAAFGKRSGVRWNTTLLCTSHYDYTIESADDFRWQISTPRRGSFSSCGSGGGSDRFD